MQTFRVVPGAPPKHIPAAYQLTRKNRLIPKDFPFQRGVERLRQRVIRARPDRSHLLGNTEPFAQLPVLLRGIDAAVVRVENRPHSGLLVESDRVRLELIGVGVLRPWWFLAFSGPFWAGVSVSTKQGTAPEPCWWDCLFGFSSHINRNRQSAFYVPATRPRAAIGLRALNPYG